MLPDSPPENETMATVTTSRARYNGYPTADRRALDSDWHRDLMNILIETLTAFYAANSRVYVSGNLLIFYEPGNKRRHVAPDVFVVCGVPKCERPNYLLWEEGKGLDFVIELTSKTTRREDCKKKFALYQDVLRVKEYFLFDPHGEYLIPQLQGYRLRAGEYRPIRAIDGRLPSQVTGLHLQRNGKELRLHDPTRVKPLPKPQEQAERAVERAKRAEAEVERVRRELAELRRRSP
jgi:Uma2 family endonuclease